MSSEVGSGHVSIFPVMTGFKGKVARETQAAGVEGGKKFAGAFQGAGTSAGRALGTGLRTSLNSTVGDLGAAQIKNLTAGVASAAAALSKARLRQQDEAGRVRVAETRLAEAVAKYGAESSQAVAAEERLASARRSQGSATDVVTAATVRLRAAQQSLADAQAASTANVVASAGGFRVFAQNLRAGFSDAKAAQSAFTGVAGSLGGIARATLDLTGLPKLTKLVAGQVSTAFTSMATMVGGGLAKGWSAAKGWMSSVGQTVQGAFSPALRYIGAVGTKLATPFVQLGQKVGTWLSPVTSQVSGLFSKIGAAAGPGLSSLAASVRAAAGPIGSAATSAFQGVVSAASRAASAAGQALGQGLQTAATGAATVAAAGIAVAFGKGFSRLTAIDTAQAKLRGLGNDAGTVTAIMGDALASVKGTSFGLGEAATVAASAVAAGIAPGEALQGHLKRIANNAAAAGLSMQDMGSIFNRAATQANGVQNDVISQLADRGIPIYAALAKQLGVTSGEVFKMASEGKIDFETFSRAAEDAAGTVAAEMGTTVPGAAKNFLASMGRIGANALSGIYAKIGPLIAAATSALGPVEEKAKQLGGVLVKVLGPAMDFVTNLLNRIGDGTLTASGGFSNILAVLGPIGGAFAALGAGGLAGVLTKVPLLGGMLGGLAGPLAALGGPLGIAAAALAGFALSGGDASAMASGFTSIVGSITAALPGIVNSIASAVPAIVGSLLSQLPLLLAAGTQMVNVLVQGLVTAIPAIMTGAFTLIQGLIAAILANLPLIIQGAVSLVTALVQGLVVAVPLLITGALTLLNGLIAGIVANLPTIIQAAITLVTALIQGIVVALPLLVQGALQLVTGLLTAIIQSLPLIIQGGVQLLVALVLGIVQALPQLLEAALNLILQLVQAIVQNLPMIIEAGVQLLLSLIDGLVNMLPQLITTAITLVLQLVAGLIQMLPELIKAGIQLIVSLIEGLVQAIPKIIAALPQIIQAIWDGFANVDWLGLGAQIIQGVIDGLGSMMGAVGDAVGGVVDFIGGFFPHSPAKRGPFSGSGWTRLRSSGAAMFDQFNAGALDEAAGFGASIQAAADAASARARFTIGTVSDTVATARTTAGQADTVRREQAGQVNNIEVQAPPDASPQELAELIAKELRWA